MRSIKRKKPNKIIDAMHETMKDLHHNRKPNSIALRLLNLIDHVGLNVLITNQI